MKKILFLCFILLTLCACSKETDDELNRATTSSDSYKTADNVRSADSSLELREIPYETLDELMVGISDEYNVDKLNEIELLEEDETKGSFRKFINNRKSDNGIYVPYYNNQIMELRNEEGYYNIILNPSSVGNQPTIGFYTKHNGKVLNIFTTYMDTLASEDILSKANENGPEWLFSQFSPEIKITELISDYKEHYVKELQLKNRTEKAIYVEYNDTSKGKIYITFPYDDILVRVFGNREAVEDWLKGADFRFIDFN